MLKVFLLLLVWGCGSGTKVVVSPEGQDGGSNPFDARAKKDCISCHKDAKFMKSKDDFLANGEVLTRIVNGSMPKGAPYSPEIREEYKKFFEAEGAL